MAIHFGLFKNTLAMKHILHIAAMALLIAGCTADPDRLPESVMSSERVMRTDTISCVDTLIYAKEFFVYNDSVLIVVNHDKYRDGHFLEFYTLPSMKQITRLYQRGHGPNEILGANADFDKNKLIIRDFYKSQMVVVYIDSVLANPNYLAQLVSYPPGSLANAVPYKGRLLSGNPYSFVDKNAGIVQEAPRFIVTDTGNSYEEKNTYKYFTWNVTGGHIIANETKDRIAYADSNMSFVEIYDMDLNLLRTITGPVDLPTQYAIHGMEGSTQQEVVFKRAIPYAYIDYCTDDDYFYLTYVGDMSGNGKTVEDLGFHIFKFDWDGNFIDSYPVSSYVRSISKSQKDNALYITTLSHEGVPVLIKMYEE